MPNLHQYSCNPVSCQSVGFVWFCFWIERKGNLKYAFKNIDFCLVWLGYSAVICGIWFLRFILCQSVRSDLAPQFCLVQVIILVFVVKI